MLLRRKLLILASLLPALYAAPTWPNTRVAAGRGLEAQTASAYNPQSRQVAAGEVDVKQLLLLMDTDKSGTISRKEFMDFMAAEFDRLDTNKSGDLDIKELERSQLTAARNGGVHR